MSETPASPPPASPSPGDIPPGSSGTPGVQYKGAPLEAGRGPGLGCFYFQLVVLAIAVVITPLSVAWGWPEVVSAVLLLVVIVLLFFAGQTMIFLGRLVAAERRSEGRRRPLASSTRTVGELEDERAARDASAPDRLEEDEPGGQSSGS